MARKLSAPTNPEFFNGVIAAIRLGSEQRQPQSPTERDVVDTLRSQALNPAVARRLASSLDAIPLNRRRELLGPMADEVALPEIASRRGGAVLEGRGVNHGLSADGSVASSGGTAASGTSARGDDVRGLTTGTFLDEEVGGTTLYTVRYQGLYAQKETDGLFSDEIYVITSVVTTNQGQNVVMEAEKHPKSHPGASYGDVDTGEERIGPVVALWQGNPDVFSLVVSVWEHDQGDPNAYREEIDYIVKAAIALAAKWYPPALALKLFEESIVDLINYLAGTGDDLLTTETKVFTRDQLESTAMGQPGPYYGRRSTGLWQHFVTEHRADGAHYVVGFDIDRNPPRPPPVIL